MHLSFNKKIFAKLFMQKLFFVVFKQGCRNRGGEGSYNLLIYCKPMYSKKKRKCREVLENVKSRARRKRNKLHEERR